MKKYALFVLMAITAATFCSCSSKKSPIKTFVMPCSDCVKADDALRVWASGTSDSETTAHKKAMATASAELAALLSKTVNTMTEQYTTELTEGRDGQSKSLLDEKNIIVVKQVLNGAAIVCDEWTKDENGQYTNYIVLELKGSKIIEAITKSAEAEGEKINQELLKTLFLKGIQERSK
jgi:hypothetical protein